MRLATLIISLALMFLLGAQSCAVTVGGSISESITTTDAEKAEAEDLAGAGAGGMLAAGLWLFGAAFVMSKPKASMWLYLVAALFCVIGGSAGFTDLFIWAAVSVGLAAMSWAGSRELGTARVGRAGTIRPPARRRPTSREKKRSALKWVGFAALVVIGLSLVAAAVGSDKDDEPSPQTPAAQETYRLGETARTGDFDVTLNEVRDPFQPTNEFEVPSENHRLVAVELTATNTGNDQQTLSTLLGAEVVDSLSRPWDIAIAGTDLPQLGGSVAPGESRRGWIVFEVASDATDLRLRIKGNLTAKGSVFLLSGGA